MNNVPTHLLQSLDNWPTFFIYDVDTRDHNYIVSSLSNFMYFRLSMANRAALNDYDFDIGFYRVKDRIELTLFSAIFLFIVYWF